MQVRSEDAENVEDAENAEDAILGSFFRRKTPYPKELVRNKYWDWWNFMLCLIGSTVFSKVETASNAAAHLTGFFFI